MQVKFSWTGAREKVQVKFSWTSAREKVQVKFSWTSARDKMKLSTRNWQMPFTDSRSMQIFQITVKPRYNDSICSQGRCHFNEFAVVKNS